MSTEVALGAVLGIAGTLVGSYAAHYFEEKQEDRRARIEEWKTVVDEVYSPMIFDLMRFQKGILGWLETIGKSLKEKSKFTEDDIAASLTLFAKMQSERRGSKLIEDILRKKSRLIKPSTLWLARAKWIRARISET